MVQYYIIRFVWLPFPTQHHTTHSLPTAKEFNVCSCCMLLPVSDVGDFLCELVLWQETFYWFIFCYMKLLSNLDYNFDVNWLDTYHAAIRIQHICFHDINLGTRQMSHLVSRNKTRADKIIIYTVYMYLYFQMQNDRKHPWRYQV